MTRQILKGLLATLVLVSFSACASNDGASGITNYEAKAHSQHTKILKKKKKARRMKKSVKAKTKVSSKFCFKDEKSIHYRSSQRCK